jgi:hypothetical protein
MAVVILLIWDPHAHNRWIRIRGPGQLLLDQVDRPFDWLLSTSDLTGLPFDEAPRRSGGQEGEHEPPVRSLGVCVGSTRSLRSRGWDV